MPVKTGDNFEEMQSIISCSNSRTKNEAETRHKIIDFVVHDFLSSVSVKLVVRYSKLLASSSPALQSSLLAG